MSSSNENSDSGEGSTGGNCLVETEYSKPDSERRGGRKGGRKKRVSYDREFLIKCFHSPASTRKPDGFPLLHLDCTLGLSKVKRLPFSSGPQPYPPPKRKEEPAKRDARGDADDNISLRPHSGNFSAGCGPNLSSPVHTPPGTNFSRIHPHDDAPKGFDRDFHRNNFRYGGGHRREMIDRPRMDRDRDMERDPRDRMNRDRLSGSSHRNSNSWSNDGPDSDWSRRRNGAHFPRERDYGGGHRRYDRDRRDFDDQEPEWFSGGPSSQHETIELRGFMDDDRREKAEKEVRNGANDRGNADHNGDVDSSSESTNNEKTRDSPMDLSIEKILKMDHIPGILPNDMLESEEPSGSSRFSQLFKRNSVTPVPGKMAQYNTHDNAGYSANDDKSSKSVHEMGELLRNMLINKKPTGVGEPGGETKVKDAGKPVPATKDDVDAFKKLVTPLFEKVLHGSSTQKKAQGTGKTPPEEGGSVLDIFKQQPKPTQQQQPAVVQEGPARSNSLQDIFNHMINKPSAPHPHGDNVPVMTPHQILQLIPPELHHLVMNINIADWDCIQLANIAKSNEWTFRQVLDNFVMQQCPPQQAMIFSGILNLVIHGRLQVPGIFVVSEQQQANHAMPPMAPQPMPNQRAPHNFVPRPGDDAPKDMAKRSGTPVSSMAFTPTSVMRKMTADGNKSMPPQAGSQGFVQVPLSGGLLPTPPTTTVMMNSNNPNLATLMANMGRPPGPQMQFRPVPVPVAPPQMMGYPNANFHPQMMAPNIHGPVMMPHPFQNILPGQPIFKAEEN